ncbi:MAG: DNA topoisomerase I, partial [Methanomicrobium sp.]|nr:DNA topoisomerase I [Methanomicrobium sp.]
PRRGRSHAKVTGAMIEGGIGDIAALADTKKQVLMKMFLSEQEAESLIYQAKCIHNKAFLKSLGIPAVSLKKYMDAGFVSADDFVNAHPAYLSEKAGINIETVYKHTAPVYEARGVKQPAKISKKAFEAGREELLKVKGIGEAMLEKLYFAGITDISALKSANTGELSKTLGISADKLEKIISEI